MLRYIGLLLVLMLIIFGCSNNDENDTNKMNDVFNENSDISISSVTGQVGGVKNELDGKISYYYFWLSCSFKNNGSGDGKINNVEFFLDDSKYPDTFLNNPISNGDWYANIQWRIDNSELSYYYPHGLEKVNIILNTSNPKEGIKVKAGFKGSLSIREKDSASSTSPSYWVFSKHPSLCSITLWVKDDNKNSYQKTRVGTFINKGITLEKDKLN